uniref:Centrosomin N-terminal motif 1 domain-containing protein n=1 Tax=Anolis carolinensis TaxID=28377 RepID=A0A803TCX0_ANOCA
MSNGYRTLSQHLNDLKKENFSLKLRIYFLEERIQQKYEAGKEDIYSRNIELKVEVESLKRELQEKQENLDKAWRRTQQIVHFTLLMYAKTTILFAPDCLHDIQRLPVLIAGVRQVNLGLPYIKESQ